MGKSMTCVALLAALVACGGQVADHAVVQDALPSVPAGVTQPPSTRPLPTGPEQVASDVGVPSALVVLGDSIVFTTSATKLGSELVQAGALFVASAKTARAGAPPLMLHVDPQGASFDTLALDGDRAVVATSDARLLSIPLAGGSVSILATLPASARTIATSGAHVFAAAADGSIVRVPRTGGEPEAIGTVAGAVRGLVVDAASVYAAVTTTETRGAIRRIDLETRETIDVADDIAAPCAMAREGDRLFWTSESGVLATTTHGNAPVTVASGSFAACALATDGASLFFATTPASAAAPGEGERARAGQPGLGLMRAPTAGGIATPIAGAAAALAQPGAVATDATHLYWLTASGVLRMTK